MRYSVLVLALAGSISLLADTEDQVRRSIPVDSSGRLVLAADWGAIRVRAGAARSAPADALPDMLKLYPQSDVTDKKTRAASGIGRGRGSSTP